MHVIVSALQHNVATFGDGEAASALSGIFGHGVATLAMNRFNFFHCFLLVGHMAQAVKLNGLMKN